MIEELKRIPSVRAGDRVVAAMSGGIDSSVMAALLHLAGFEVVGVSMQLFDKGAFAQNSAGRCCTLDDFHDARKVAHRMGFTHYVMNFESRFKAEVMDPFVVSYLQGDTPSPCVLCNKHLKFDSLIQTANDLGADFVATGHYAKILKDAAGYHLMKARDSAKDQSYFLFSHNQSTLSRTLFPLETLTKQQVRDLATQMDLHLAEKAESQEICFIPQNRYDTFIEENGAAPGSGEGPIRHVGGSLLGTHQGFWRFTIGQRKGLKVAHGSPLYVVSTDPATNTVWVGEEEHLFSSSFTVRDVSWCLQAPDSLACSVKLRSRSAEVPARIEAIDSERVKVRLETPQRAVTPGQAAVFYRGEEVLGGGWISRDQ